MGKTKEIHVKPYGVSQMKDDLSAFHQEFDTIDKRCLQMFAESIREANRCGRNKWGVTRFSGRVRLIVGGIMVCYLDGPGNWCAIDKDLTSSADYVLASDSGDWQPKRPMGRQVSSLGGVYTPSERHSAVWPSIRRMHFALIQEAAIKFKLLRNHCQKAHLETFMQYLREATNQPDLPNPVYKADAAQVVARPNYGDSYDIR